MQRGALYPIELGIYICNMRVKESLQVQTILPNNAEHNLAMDIVIY